MGQIRTGPSVSEPHQQVQAKSERQPQANALPQEPNTIHQTQQGARANEALPPQPQQQHHQPQPNQQAHGVAGQPTAPPEPVQFPPQHPAEYPPQSQQQQPVPVNFPQTNGMMYSNQPNQGAGVIHQYQHTIYQQPPRSYPQNRTQPFVSSSYVSHSQTFHDVTYPVPPQNAVMPPYISQVNPATGVPVPVESWKTGLFDCMDDPINALVTLCFPCLTFGQVAEIVDEGQTSCGTSGLLYGLIACFIGVPCILSCAYRTKLRNKLGLAESPAPDWVTHCCCDWCAICQEYRELQHRGWDPSIGWHGNLAKRQSMQQQHIAMMPPINQTMFA